MSVEKTASVNENIFSAEEHPLLNSAHIAEFVQKYGGSASVALLDPACQIFSTPAIDGIIGYRSTPRCAVVFGDPVCEQNDKLTLASEFRKYCKKKGLCIVYATVTKEFAYLSIKNGCGAFVEVGEELILNPQIDYIQGAKGRKLRTKVHQAQHLGVSVHEYQNHNPELEKEIEQAAYSWLQGRKGPQIYLAHVHLFANRCGKRWFYAKQGENIVGTLLLNQLQAQQGWVLNLLMTTSQAPQSTSEYLVASTLQILQKEGCRFFTLGSVPAPQLGEIQGLNKFYSQIARIGFKSALKIFKLDGRKMYWSKFHPTTEGCYFLFEERSVGFNEIVGILRALNVGI